MYYDLPSTNVLFLCLSVCIYTQLTINFMFLHVQNYMLIVDHLPPEVRDPLSSFYPKFVKSFHSPQRKINYQITEFFYFLLFTCSVYSLKERIPERICLQFIQFPLQPEDFLVCSYRKQLE